MQNKQKRSEKDEIESGAGRTVKFLYIRIVIVGISFKIGKKCLKNGLLYVTLESFKYRSLYPERGEWSLFLQDGRGRGQYHRYVGYCFGSGRGGGKNRAKRGAKCHSSNFLLHI